MDNERQRRDAGVVLISKVALICLFVTVLYLVCCFGHHEKTIIFTTVLAAVPVEML
jgi:hypothetical protein